MTAEHGSETADEFVVDEVEEWTKNVQQDKKKHDERACKEAAERSVGWTSVVWKDYAQDKELNARVSVKIRSC